MHIYIVINTQSGTQHVITADHPQDAEQLLKEWYEWMGMSHIFPLSHFRIHCVSGVLDVADLRSWLDRERAAKAVPA